MGIRGAHRGCAGSPEQVSKVWPPLGARSPRAEVCVGRRTHSSGAAGGGRSEAAQGPTGSHVSLRASEPIRQGELATCSPPRSVNSVHTDPLICATLPGAQSTATVLTLTMWVRNPRPPALGGVFEV